MKITIYNPDSTIFKEVVLLDGSMMTNGIRENHDVTLCFSSEEELAIPEGAYVVFNGETFIAKSRSKMEMSNTRSYTYTIKMNGAPSALSSVRLRNPADGKLSFPYTASAHDHLALIVSNMNRYGGGGWVVGDCIYGGEKFLQYNYISCRDALDSLADTYGTEWEIVGKTISLHKVEYNFDSPLELSYGKGSGLRPGIIRDNVQTPMTRLYTQGGSKNIDASEYGSTILLLPKSVTFKYDGNKFEDEQGFDETKARIYSTDSEGTHIKSHKNKDKDVNEGVIDCTDIYPNKLHTVLEVESGDNPRDIVLDIDEDLDYSQYQIAGEIPTITFQSGELMGKTFEIRRDQGGIIMVSKKYSAQGSFVGWKLTLSGTFESGRWLPDSQSGLVPAVGDTCRIFGVRMPSQYICDNNTKSGASWDMLRRGIMYLFECEDYIYSLKMPVDPIWARANWGSVGSKFVAGGYVRYSNSGWAQGGVVMRIKTIRKDISKPYSIEISLSNGIVGGGVLKGLSDSISNQAGSISEQQDTQKKLEYDVSSLSRNYVTIDTEQTITAHKTFAEDVTFGAAREDGTYSRLLIPSTSGPGIYDLYVSTEPVDGEAPTASGGIDEDELWTILGGSGTQKIGKSHIPPLSELSGNLDSSRITGLDAALTSYATKEWVEGKGYLTSVSLSTISDLHASWDTLLQSAPDFYSKSSVYTKSEADGRYVGIANQQTITGRKTFSALLTASAGISGTNADLSGYLSATKVYLPYSGGNKVYDILISTQPIDGEAPSEGGGINEDELWTILGGSGTQKIGASHIPPLSELSGNLDSSRITGLDTALTGYVKKAGDTMTGRLIIDASVADLLHIDSSNSTETFIKVFRNGIQKAAFGYYDGRGSFMYNWVGGYYFELTDGGGLQLHKGGTLLGNIWHSGNDGSGSGLDADLLDGYQANDMMILGRSVNMLSGSTYSGYIPPLVLAMMRGAEQIENPTFLNGSNLGIYNNNTNGSVTHTRMTDATAGNGSGYVLKIHSSASASPGGGGFTFSTSKAYRQTTCVFRAKVPAGYTINFATNSVGSGGLAKQWLTERTGTGKWEWYACSVYFGSSPSTSHFYYLTPAANVDWYLAYAQVFYNSEALYVGMQAQKADRLTTSRTLWGRPFDGTGNVSGDITADNFYLRSTNNPLLRLNNESVSAAYLQLANTNGGILSIDYGLSSGKNISILYSNGYVGIGTTSPASKLDVAGTFRVRNELRCDYWLRNTVNGRGLYNEAVDARWYADDNGWHSDKDVRVGGSLIVSGRLYIPSSSGNNVFDAYIA